MAKDKGSLAEQGKTGRHEAAPKDSELVQKVPIKDIEINTSARSIDSDAVDALAASMEVSGQISPIVIYRAPGGTLTVVAGNHRLAAAGKLVGRRSMRRSSTSMTSTARFYRSTKI